MSPPFIMPETDPEVIGPTTVDVIRMGAFEVKLARPKEPGRLLDLETVAEAYDKDEYMPYWAALWPVAKHLGREMVAETWPKGVRALELGCGLGLPGLAVLKAGMHVTFSDYDASALKFVAESARINGLTEFRLLLLDWRDPPPDLYDVIIASDLTYEERNVVPLVELFGKVLAPGGEVWLADQNRKYQELLEATLKKHGFRYTSNQFEAVPDEGYEVSGRVYRIRRS